MLKYVVRESYDSIEDNFFSKINSCHKETTERRYLKYNHHEGWNGIAPGRSAG
jgi:23S rRNA maturation-related 3'-5' exoribonuclease YhaM